MSISSCSTKGHTWSDKFSLQTLEVIDGILGPIYSINQLNGCGGDEVYLLKSKEHKKLVVKKLRPDFTFTENEIKYTIWASDNDIGPKLYSHYNNELVMECLEELASESSEFSEHPRDAISFTDRDVVNQMKRMHSIDSDNTNFVSQSYKVFQEEKRQAGVSPRCMQPMFQYVEETMELLSKSDSSIAICHNDLHLRNMLFSGMDLKFIDWPFAGSDYVLVDIAQTAALIQIRPDELLDQYYGVGFGSDDPSKFPSGIKEADKLLKDRRSSTGESNEVRDSLEEIYSRVIPLPYAYRVCFPLIGLDVTADEIDRLWEEGDFLLYRDCFSLLNKGKLDLSDPDKRVKFSLSMLHGFYRHLEYKF